MVEGTDGELVDSVDKWHICRDALVMYNVMPQRQREDRQFMKVRAYQQLST